VNPGNKIFIEIDSFEGIQIKECVELSRFVEQNLDRDVEDFELQVSSPGLDQPFKITKQYQKYMDKEVEVLLKNGQKLLGKLINANDEQIVIQKTEKIKDEKTKKKVIVFNDLAFKYSEIKETKVVISFK